MTARPHFASRALASALIAIAALLSVNAVSAWVVMDGGMATVTLIVVVAALGAIITRARSRSRVLPTAVGFIAAVLVTVPFFAVNPDGSRHWLPTPEALGMLGEVFRDGVIYAEATVPPAGLTPGLTLIMATAVVMTFLAADLVGVGLGYAATAGLILIAPWLPAVVIDKSVPLVPLAVTVGCWVATLGLIRDDEPTDHPPRQVFAPLVTASAVVAVAALVSPLLLGGPGWGTFPRFGSATAGAEVTRLSLDLDLRASLGAQSAVPVMRYTTDGGRPSAFKLHTVTGFDGTAWADSAATNLEERDNDDVLWSADVPEWDDQRLMQIEMEPVGVGEANLPLPTAPRTVTSTHSWAYDGQLDEAQSASSTLQGQTLNFEAATSYVTGERLQGAQGAIDAGDNAVDEAYTDVPDSMDVDRVGSLAREITADAATRHEQAVALQQYLRDPMTFTYDTSVPDSTDDAVGTFLDNRAGYCVQFATTMTMMARTLDIPARLGVGYLPGQPTAAGEYVVTGADAHAWPELWFPTVGWIRFEPTPAVQTGSAPWYATAAAVDTAQAPSPQEQATQAPDEPELPDEVTPTNEATVTSSSPSQSDEGPLWWLLAAAGVLLLAAAVGAWIRHRRAKPPLKHAADAVWDELRREIPEGYRWPDSATPAEAVGYVRSVCEDGGALLSRSADDALEALAHEVTTYRYAPGGSTVSMAQLREWKTAVTAELTSSSARTTRR